MKIFKIPFSAGCLGKNIGTEKAPDAIVDSLKEVYSSEGKKVIHFDIDSIDVDNSNVSLSHEKILEKMKTVSEKAIVLGGDHSITYSCFKSLDDAGLIIFDAHPDLMEGTDVVSHEDWLRKLIDEGLSPARIILVAIRNSDEAEIRFMDENKMRVYTMKDVFNIGVKELCDLIMEQAIRWPKLYVSVDIDAVDPAFAPGTGYLEAGGLTSREMIYIVQRLKMMKNLHMIDLVEVNPKKDPDLTPKLAAKLVYEFSG